MKQVFVYGGQGTQYYQMAKELYDNNLIFKQKIDELDGIVEKKTGRSIINAMYNSPHSKQQIPQQIPQNSPQRFDNILDSHPAVFCLGYSLTHVLMNAGFKPDAVIGHSLGEYIAAVVSGILAFDDALDLVIEQARLLDQYERKGGLVCIVDSADLFYQRPELFSGVSFGGVNFSNNFFVSGYQEEIESLKVKLENEEILSIQLPVNYGFHSMAIDAIKDRYITYINNIVIKSPCMPMYSSILANRVDDGALNNPSEYLWQVVRGRVNFRALMLTAFTDPEEYFFVDLSASASLANFLKYMDDGKNRYKCGFMLNQFGKDMASVETLLSQLDNFGHK